MLFDSGYKKHANNNSDLASQGHVTSLLLFIMVSDTENAIYFCQYINVFLFFVFCFFIIVLFLHFTKHILKIYYKSNTLMPNNGS